MTKIKPKKLADAPKVKATKAKKQQAATGKASRRLDKDLELTFPASDPITKY
jgi:hypothetical protein